MSHNNNIIMRCVITSGAKTRLHREMYVNNYNKFHLQICMYVYVSMVQQRLRAFTISISQSYLVVLNACKEDEWKGKGE